MLHRVKAERHAENERDGLGVAVPLASDSHALGSVVWGELERHAAGQLIKPELRQLQSLVVVGPQVRERIVAEQRDLTDAGAYII